VWFHASPGEIDGGFIIPADESGCQNVGMRMQHSYRRDRVSIYEAESDDRLRHHGEYAFNGRNAWIYRVEPEGMLEDDPADPCGVKG
jgi:hypothetical protein